MWIWRRQLTDYPTNRELALDCVISTLLKYGQTLLLAAGGHYLGFVGAFRRPTESLWPRLPGKDFTDRCGPKCPTVAGVARKANSARARRSYEPSRRGLFSGCSCS